MEQLIILIIFYVLYAVFNGLSRKLKNPQPPPKQPFPGTPANRPASTTTSPGGTPTNMERREKPVPTIAEEEPEIELPPFLREMLGLDKPQQHPEPLPRQEVVPAKMAKEEAYPGEFEGMEAISLETFEKAKSLKESEAVKKEDESPGAIKEESLAAQISVAHPLRDMLRNKNNFKKAFILKEVLDAPISKRRGKNPYSGRV